MTASPLSVQDVAHYLREHPDFFDQNPELLSGLLLPHPTNGQAISLVERQSMLLRERIKSLEARMAELIGHGQENDRLVELLVSWARQLLQQTDPSFMPETVIEELKRIFDVPYGAVRLWRVRDEFAHLPAASAVNEDAPALANSMLSPYCGANVGFEPAAWLNHDPAAVQSLVMLPLRAAGTEQTFGLVVLGSPDKDRFHVTMGTVFLRRIADIAGAALLRLAR
ncbi:MAG: hypothetical protein RL669_1480 [Pseudomonadota bacterium]|jgi:uncharacterized protein YigA (DUF484 family)